MRNYFTFLSSLSSLSSRSSSFVLATALCLTLGANLSPLTAEAQSSNDNVQNARVEKQAFPETQRQAEALLNRVIQANQLSPKMVSSLEIVDTKDLNAATDGKKIIFTKALWDTLETEDQRAFVLSHELAHISLNHVPKAMVRRVSFLGLGKLFSGRLFRKDSNKSKLLNQASQAGLVLADLKFSRRAEYGADDLGLKMMNKAGYSTQGAVETLEVLAKASPSKTPQFLMSHPLSKNRINRLAKRYDNVSFK